MRLRVAVAILSVALNLSDRLELFQLDFRVKATELRLWGPAQSVIFGKHRRTSFHRLCEFYTLSCSAINDSPGGVFNSIFQISCC